ncbi:MAG TPA: hypothetical protein VM692_15380 [Gammaproteobacteria bacterium]|nr:hypothetical protein [Gammaproteobacteria bacterium]
MIQFKPGLVQEDGTVTNDSTAQFLSGFMREFYTFIVRVYTVLPRNVDAQAGRSRGAREELRH